MKINKFTKVKIDKDLIDDEVLSEYIRSLEVIYIQGLSWLVWYPWIVAKNNTKEEENPELYKQEQDNLKSLEKQLKNIEDNIDDITTKIKFFKSIKNG